MDIPNSVEESQENADANSQADDLNRTDSDTADTTDYKEKFSASSREAQRLLEEVRAKDAKIAELEQNSGTSESLYPGFEELDEEAQKNLMDYTNTVTERVRGDLNKDPAIAFARQSYNENKFSTAMTKVLDKFPELNDSKDEFKSKYFQPNNVPDNIEEVLGDLAKVHLFDKARDLGAKDEQERAGRIDLERAHAGEKPNNISSRSLEEWQRLANENPAKFAALSKEYQTDLETGKLKE